MPTRVIGGRRVPPARDLDAALDRSFLSPGSRRTLTGTPAAPAAASSPARSFAGLPAPFLFRFAVSRLRESRRPLLGAFLHLLIVLREGRVRRVPLGPPPPPSSPRTRSRLLGFRFHCCGRDWRILFVMGPIHVDRGLSLG